MYNKFNIKNFLSTYERWGFGCEESRVWQNDKNIRIDRLGDFYL